MRCKETDERPERHPGRLKGKDQSKSQPARRERYMPSEQWDPRLPAQIRQKKSFIIVELIHAVLVGPLRGH